METGTTCIRTEEWRQIPGLVPVMSTVPVCGSRMQSKASGSSLETGGGIAIRTEVIRQITGKPLTIRSIILTQMAGCRLAGRRSMEPGIIWDQQVMEQ